MTAVPNVRLLTALMTRSHVFWYRATGGIFGGSLAGAPILLLTTTGRRTGRRRTVPLLYVLDGEAFVVIASNSRDAHHPAWYHNLRTRPDASVQVRGDGIAVRGRDATPEEHARLWPAITRAYPAYLEYERRGGRPIPLVVLERVAVRGRA
jgi:deazaflavin-dependent oxidoreductase (nitroreductase family)